MEKLFGIRRGGLRRKTKLRKEGGSREPGGHNNIPRLHHAVLFVEQSPNGGLATCLRELLARLEPIL